jgi:chorismate mutase
MNCSRPGGNVRRAVLHTANLGTARFVVEAVSRTTELPQCPGFLGKQGDPMLSREERNRIDGEIRLLISQNRHRRSQIAVLKGQKAECRDGIREEERLQRRADRYGYVPGHVPSRAGIISYNIQCKIDELYGEIEEADAKIVRLQSQRNS